MKEPEVGGMWRKKRIREVVRLSNGWHVIKTDNSKSLGDFKVRTIFSLEPVRSMTPKHAHFAIDLYGKLCYDRAKAQQVLKAIIEVWSGEQVEKVLDRYQKIVEGLPGYTLEYTLQAVGWILDQEDANFTGRPEKKQRQLDEICGKQGVNTPPKRLGSQLAVSLMCDIVSGSHPVEALLRASLDVSPRRRGK